MSTKHTPCSFTDTQMYRLAELGQHMSDIPHTFADEHERNCSFQNVEHAAIAQNRENLRTSVCTTREPALCRLQRSLAARLHSEGFAEVVTPTIITASQLDKMSVTKDKPLRKQVFWVDSTHCLRPMLAPGLYVVSRKMMGSLSLPLRTFEIGSCFRKESEGSTHLQEFTMVDLVEWGTPVEERDDRLREFMAMITDEVGLPGWKGADDESVVYGHGIDTVDEKGLELASSSMGPHPLDAAWGIDCTWVGIGFGLERLLQSREHTDNIHRFARSTTYYDGASLNIK
ncbi:MAG: pyrrolysine--tRNA(Pyl) ligase large subunit [Eggerthellaceae bacterium]|nr:pyrrolysine--tRNA(Pyl) ligase large subunit [Eggerthellaceae bacterium]